MCVFVRACVCVCAHACIHIMYMCTGGGSLFVLDIVQDTLRPVQVFQFSDGMFDVTWAENNENILVGAGGDGSIQVWDVLQPQVRFHIVTW